MTPRPAGAPDRQPPPPAAVARLAGHRPVDAVWENELGGITFRIGAPAELFVKWQPPGTPIDLTAEARRLRWLAPHTPVPAVLGAGSDDAGEWLATGALPGTSAVDERWNADPGPAVEALGRALRRFHDSVPVDGCPFDWSVRERVGRAGDAGVGPAPDVDLLVVCHGDACAPNTLLGDDGSFVGHVDLGRCGVADRWADLAVGSMSLEWNYGPGWEVRYFAAYGIDPDPARTTFYRRLWDAT